MSKILNESNVSQRGSEKVKLRTEIEQATRNLFIANKNYSSNSKLFKVKVYELETTKTSLRSTISTFNREIDRWLTDINTMKMAAGALIRTCTAQGNDKREVMKAIGMTEKDLVFSTPIKKTPSQRSLTMEPHEDKENRFLGGAKYSPLKQSRYSPPKSS